MKIFANCRLLPDLWLYLLCFAIFLGCSGSKLPEQVLGRWESDHERYRDCFMQIEPERIIFGNSEKNTGGGAIQKVTQSKKGSRQIVRIEYIDPAGTRFTLNLVPAGNSIWFENQPSVVWKRGLLIKAPQ